MRYKIAKFVCALFLTNAFAFAQSAKEQLSIANAAKLASTNFYDEVPFKDKLGYYTIQVKIDTTTYEYIFDTGGFNTVTSEIMENAKLPTLMEVEVGSSNKIKSKIKLSKIPSLQIGKTIFQDVGVFGFDFTASPVINCYTNAGLIGRSVIHKAIWQIDYRKSVLRISDNLAQMPSIDKGEKIKIELDKTLLPFLKISINGKQERFMLDLGFGGFVSLTEKTASSLKFKNTIAIEGEGNISANGVINEKSFVSLLENVQIGKTELKNQVGFYSKSNNYNLLGAALAKYFIITLNFKDNELILTPYDQTEYSFETFGFSVNADTSKIYVNKIFDGLNAQKAGLELNDELISINGKVLGSLSYCDQYFVVNNLLTTEQEVTVVVKRGEQQKEFRIAKQKPF